MDSVNDLGVRGNGQKRSQPGGERPVAGVEPVVSVVRKTIEQRQRERDQAPRIVIENANGDKTDAADFRVFFYARTAS